LNPNDTSEIADTPPASPAEITTPEPTDPVNPQGAGVPGSPEEVEFNGLKGDTQTRVRDLIRERNDERARAERLQNFVYSQQQSQSSIPSAGIDPNSPEVRNAVSQLANVGISTDEKVENLVNQRIGNLVWNFELEKLENRHNGADGKAKFDRTEYADFIQRNPQYQGYMPEDVYEKMYPGEVASGQPVANRSTTLRPTRTTVREEQWTPESIETRLQESDGKEWYVKNKTLINKVLSEQTPNQQ